MVYALEHSFSRASVMPEKKLREEALRCVTAASDRRMWSGGAVMITSGRPSQSDWEVWEFWELSQNGWEFVPK